MARKGRKDRGLLPQTVLHYLKFLRHVLNVAVRDGRLEKNPVSKIDLPKVHGGKLRYLSLEEEVRLCEMIGPTYTP